MRPTTATICALAVLLPVSVEMPGDPDSSAWGETSLSAYGSVGRLAMIDRGCEGQVLQTHPREFEEVAGELEHRFPNAFAIGMRGGKVTERGESRSIVYDYTTYPYSESLVVVRSEFSNGYVNPSIAYEGEEVGIGVGYVASDRPFPSDTGPPKEMPVSGHVRVGSPDGKFFRIAYMENVPLYAGGGYLETGIGFHPHRLWHGYLGLSAGGPYDGAGLKLDLDYRVARNVGLSGRARVGNSGGETQSGFGLGVTYTTRPPVTPGRRWDDFAMIRGASGSAWGLSKPPASSEPSDRRPPGGVRHE